MTALVSDPAASGGAPALGGSDAYKRLAAQTAADEIESGMVVGLGTGSTADHFIRALSVRVRAGLRVTGVSTSERTARVAAAEGIALTTLDRHPVLDAAVDGADEIDPGLRLIKGGGGAHLREKIVAAAARRMVVIADRAKLVPVLGAFPLPIEVIAFGLGSVRLALENLASRLGLSGPVTLRLGAGGEPVRTDCGNVILDASFGLIRDPEALAAGLDRIPGVVEHGLFIGLASEAILGGPTGVERLSAASSAGRS